MKQSVKVCMRVSVCIYIHIISHIYIYIYICSYLYIYDSIEFDIPYSNVCMLCITSVSIYIQALNKSTLLSFSHHPHIVCTQVFLLCFYITHVRSIVCCSFFPSFFFVSHNEIIPIKLLPAND